MTGVAAIAICAAFTSCSKSGDDLYNPEVIQQNEAAQIVEKYNQAFLKYVGASSAADIPANQTWGFGGYAAGTRGFGTRTATQIDVNGNMENYKDAPTLGATEESDVTNYVRNLTTLPNTKPTQLTTYFVRQVHCGTETYKNADGAGGILGSSKMNNLHIAMEAGGVVNSDGTLSTVGDWQHINNFNRGDNTDWNGNTLVINGGTYNFAYHGAEDSRYHDRWIAVDGKNVPKADGGNYDGYWYICFDFEGAYAGGYTMIQGNWYNPDSPNGNKWDNFNNIKLPGDWTNADWSTCNLTIDWKYTVEGVEKTITLHLNNSSEVQNIQTSNYVGGNMVIEGNNKYDDWIVRLVAAEPKEEIIETDPDDVCIIAEDLTINGDTDFDWNDVVFTVHYTSTSTATVTLYAAGGTLPLTVAGEEVHAKFGYADPNEKGLYMMINTGAKADINGVPTVSFPVNSQKSTRGKDIKIMVDKGTKNEAGVHVPNWIELEATGGEPAAKVCVGVEFATGQKWCEERQSIKEIYPRFSEWVLNDPALLWWRK